MYGCGWTKNQGKRQQAVYQIARCYRFRIYYILVGAMRLGTIFRCQLPGRINLFASN